MALACKCDRCGKFYEIYNMRDSEKHPNSFMFTNIDMNQKFYKQNVRYLCPDCSEMLVEWFSHKEPLTCHISSIDKAYKILCGVYGSNVRMLTISELEEAIKTAITYLGQTLSGIKEEA